MFELISALFIIVTVFVIFGRDEEGTTRFERRKMKQLQNAYDNASGTPGYIVQLGADRQVQPAEKAALWQNEQNRAS